MDQTTFKFTLYFNFPWCPHDKIFNVIIIVSIIPLFKWGLNVSDQATLFVLNTAKENNNIMKFIINIIIIVIIIIIIKI